jgi:hypothetical protein
MTTQNFVYSFADINSTISGPGGFNFQIGSGAGVDEGGISIAFEKDFGSVTTGADGTPQHSLHTARNGTVTVRVQKTSPTNALLSAMLNTQQASSALWGQNTISVANLVVGDDFNCQQCSFRKFPDNTNAVEAGMNEWVFLAGIITATLGSGSPVTATTNA